MKIRDQQLLRRLLSERLTFFDRRKIQSKIQVIVSNIFWMFSLLIGVFIIVSIMYKINISSGSLITILTIIISILFPVYIERTQRPELRIYAATLDKTLYGSEYFWALKILVDHPPLTNDWRSLFARSWLEKRTAVGCRGFVKFYTKDRSPVIVERKLWSTFSEAALQPRQVYTTSSTNAIPGTVSQWDIERLTTISGGITPGYNTSFVQTTPTPDPKPTSLITRSQELALMPARWAGSLQPSQPDAIIRIGNKLGAVHRFIESIDIAPEDDNALDIVIQYDNDGICYGWNNEVYTLENPRMAQWKLEPGQYLLEVTIFYGDRKFTECFSLKNTVNTLEFKPLKN